MKRKISIFAISMLTFISQLAFAEQVIKCQPPIGSRVDYFTSNTVNEPNLTFLPSNAPLSIPIYLIIREGNKGVSFILGDLDKSSNQLNKPNMRILFSSEDQISFAGLVKDLYTMATFYPKSNVLIYSEQGAWSGQALTGSQATLFYSQCAINNPNQ